MSKEIILFVYVLAGGAGKRLHPLSTNKYPKQFWSIFENGITLLQNAIIFNNLSFIDNITVITSTKHRDIAIEQVSSIDPTCRIICEEQGGGTFISAIIAAFDAHKRNSEACVLLVPSDHIIRDKVKYAEAVLSALNIARLGAFVMFGMPIKDLSPEYGYIEPSFIKHSIYKKITKVKNFYEKPSIQNLKAMYKSKKLLCNSGIFMFQAKAFLRNIKRHFGILYKSMSQMCKYLNHNAFCDHVYIPTNLSTFHSIDKEYCEKLNDTFVVSMNVNWKDLGSWDVLIDELLASERAKIQRVKYDEFTDYKINGTYNESNLMDNGTLAFDYTNFKSNWHDERLEHEFGVYEEIERLHYQCCVLNYILKNCILGSYQSCFNLKDEGFIIKDEGYAKDIKPWGTSYDLTKRGGRLLLKRLVVHPGHRISLQSHSCRTEHWFIVQGVGEIIVGDTVIIAKSPHYVMIPVNKQHRVRNLSLDVDLQILELQCGDLLCESDITRLSDDYGRI